MKQRTKRKVEQRLLEGKVKTMRKDEVYKQLVIDEGVKYEIYLDHLGYPTFGIGHLVTDLDEESGQPVGTPVSEKRVQECFEEDLNIAVSECVILYGGAWETFPDEVQQIVVNMMFNLGRPRLSKFQNFKSALEEGDWKRAAVEGRDSLWYRQVTNRAERLMSRMENVT